MPESGTDKYDHQIAAGNKCPLPASAKRNVKVVLEPAGERYMPSAPELSHGPGQIWIIKVLRQLKAQHFTKAHRHIGITGKIKINLQCIQDSHIPSQTSADLVHGIGQNLVHHASELVGKYNLFSQSVDKAPCSACKQFRRHMAVSDARTHTLIALDGSLYHLRKKGHVKSQVQQVPLGPCGPPVHIRHIRYHLKCVK